MFKIFVMAFIQIFLVSANTYFISKSYWIGIALAGFGISWFWSSNVKYIAFADKRYKLIYSIGATMGGIFGAWISKLILE